MKTSGTKPMKNTMRKSTMKQTTKAPTMQMKKPGMGKKC